MSIKTRFEKASAEGDWVQWCKSLLDLYSTEKQFIVDDIQKISHLRMTKWILGHKFPNKELILRNLILDAMMSADQRVAGSSVYVPWFLFEDTQLIPIRKASIDYLKATLALSFNEEVRQLFQAIYETVGPLTKIIIKKSYEQSNIIKYKNAFSFPLELDAQFHRIIGHTKLIEQTNPIIIMIEGSPETVGEINSLLQWNHENQRPVILIARSFPEEISATLATNWLRGSLSVLPIPYGTTIESINLAADMCAISKGELISAHFGDIITSALLNEDKWGTVDRAEWANGTLSLQKEVDVSRHVSGLIKKLKSIEEEDVQKIYRDRILSLSNDAIEVWVNKNNHQVLEELDALIKHYNGFVTSGSVETPIGEIPSSFAAAAKATAKSLKDKLVNIGGFLVGVENKSQAS